MSVDTIDYDFEACKGAFSLAVISMACLVVVIGVSFLELILLFCDKIPEEHMSFDTKIITGTEQQKKKLKEVRLREMKRMRRLNTFAGLYVPESFGFMYKIIVLLPRAVLFILFPLNLFIFEATCPTYQSYTEYKAGEDYNFWDKTTLSKAACAIPLFIFIAWHTYGPIHFWTDPILAQLDRSGLILEQIEFYQSLQDYRYIVNFFIVWIVVSTIMNSVSTFYWSGTCTYNDDIGLHGNWPLEWCDEDYSSMASYYLGWYEFVRCGCYIVPFVMLCQILFHVKAYHLIVTRFVGSVDLVMNDRLEYDSETREQLEVTMHNAQRFLHWLFLLASFIVCGLIAATLSITYRNATLPYLILNSSFLFLIALSLLLPIFCVNACMGDYWEIVHVLKIVCLLFTFTLVVGVFFLEVVQVVFQMFIGGCLMISVFIYYIFESAYMTVYSAIESATKMHDQPGDAVFGVVEVFLPHQKSMMERNFSKAKSIGGDVYRAFNERNLNHAIHALEETGEMVTQYNEMFAKMLNQCEGSEMYDTLKPYLDQVQKIGNRAHIVGSTVQQAVSMMLGQVEGIDYEEVQELIEMKVNVMQNLFENPKHLADPKVIGQVLDDLELILIFLNSCGKDVKNISASLKTIRAAFSSLTADVDFASPGLLKQLRSAAERQSERMLSDLLEDYNFSPTQKDAARALVKRAVLSVQNAEFPEEELASLRALFSERDGPEEFLLDPQQEIDNLALFFEAIVKTLRASRQKIYDMLELRLSNTLKSTAEKYEIQEGQLGLIQEYLNKALDEAREGTMPLANLDKIESLLKEYSGESFDSTDFNIFHSLFERYVETFTARRGSPPIEIEPDPQAALPVMSETTPLLEVNQV